MHTSDESGNPSPVEKHEFVKVFTENARRIHGYILTLTVNYADADEAFQETSMVLWRKYGQFDPSLGSFYTWACQIAFYEVLHVRRRKRPSAILDEKVILILAEEAEKRSDDFKQRERALEECLKELPSKDRQLIELRYMHARRTKEIAEILDRSTHAVYRTLTRIHGVLRRCVSRKLLHEGV